MRRGNRSGYIYAIEEEGSEYVKFGWSAGPDYRCGNLQTGNPRALSVAMELRGTKADERALHKRFGHHRVRGEWFRYTGEIRLFIARTVVRQMTEPERSEFLQWLTSEGLTPEEKRQLKEMLDA